MERIIGSVPQIDWQSKNLPSAWNSLKEHSEVEFRGPLKDRSEEERCNYLMIWVGKKGREIYKTFSLTNEEKKNLKVLYEKVDVYVKPKLTPLLTPKKRGVCLM